MKIDDLDFPYPESLVATERAAKSRIMFNRAGRQEPEELKDLDALLNEFRAGDLLVINDSRVLKRRVFTESQLEILFLKPLTTDRTQWQVMCPSSRWKNGEKQILPRGIELELTERGRIQVVTSNHPLGEAFFEEHGEMPLPPYIQKARGERHNRKGDSAKYQTAWAENDGSLAAPTASLHFDQPTIEFLKSKGVTVAKITLHVGLGTFMPIHAENLDEHVMHAESVEVPAKTWQAVLATQSRGGRVWALGTTVTRTLESVAHGRLRAKGDGSYEGETDLFIRPGFEFRAVDVLMTNFHQPRSTLIALVGAFAGLEKVKRSYQWAIERGFRLFSYGDLTVWTR